MDERDYLVEMFNEQIHELKQENQLLREEIDRLTTLNRHYFFKFYNGDITKMQADFNYIE